MEHIDLIDRVLQKIKIKFGAYIGEKSVHRLATFLSGFECAIFELTNQRCNFNSTFQRYVEEKYGEDSTRHWSEIISEKRTPEGAFDHFF